MNKKETNYCRVFISTNSNEKKFVCFADEGSKCQFFKESKHLPYVCYYRRESKYVLDYCFSREARKDTRSIVFQNILKEIEGNDDRE